MKKLSSVVIITLFITITVAISLTWIKNPADAPNLANVASSIFSAFGVLLAYLTVKESTNDRIERAKPFVMADFHYNSSGFVTFCIRNISNNLARDVEVHFDPVPTTFIGEKITDWVLLQRPFDLAPQTQEVTKFHLSNKLLNSDDIKVFTVTLNYKSSDGIECGPTTYNFDLNKGRRMRPVETTDDWLRKIGDQLEAIQKELAVRPGSDT